MKKFIKNKKYVFLILLYAIFLAIFLINGIVNLQSYISKLSSGKICPDEISFKSFETNAINPRLQGWQNYSDPMVSTDSDPQMFYKTPVTISSISFTLKSHILPGESRLYYKLNSSDSYNDKHSLSPTYIDYATGRYVYVFNPLTVAEFRLDPISAAGCIFEISDIKINSDNTPAQFFVPKLWQLAVFIFAPIIIYAVFLQVVQALQLSAADKNNQNQKN